MELDDLADLVGDLPETVTLQLLKSLDQQDRERLRTVLSFAEDSAGGLMNTDAVSLRPDVTVEVVLRYLRMRGELPEKTDRLFVVDRHDSYLGTVPLTRLLTERSGAARSASCSRARRRASIRKRRRTKWRSCSRTGPRLRRGGEHGRAAARAHHHRRRGRRHPRGSRALRAEHGRPARRGRRVRRRARLHEAAPVLARHQPAHRASSPALVVQRFEGTIEKVAALAALMPIVASMGGIAGTQTVTLIIRGLALGQMQWATRGGCCSRRSRVGGAERAHLGGCRRRDHDVLVRHVEDRA